MKNAQIGRWIGVGMAITLFSASFAGCGGGGTTRDTVPPTLRSATISPTPLRYTGGTILLSVDAIDIGGIKSVWVVITPADGDTIWVDLTGSGSNYQGSWTAPGNGDTEDRIYTARFFAVDYDINVSASAPFTVTVKGVANPPAPAF